MNKSSFLLECLRSSFSCCCCSRDLVVSVVVSPRWCGGSRKRKLLRESPNDCTNIGGNPDDLHRQPNDRRLTCDDPLCSILMLADGDSDCCCKSSSHCYYCFRSFPSFSKKQKGSQVFPHLFGLLPPPALATFLNHVVAGHSPPLPRNNASASWILVVWISIAIPALAFVLPLVDFLGQLSGIPFNSM